MHLDIIEGNVNHLAIGLFDQPEFNEADDVGVDVGVVAGGGLGEGVDAAWAVLAQGIQQVEAGRCDFGEELAGGLEAEMKILIAASRDVGHCRVEDVVARADFDDCFHCRFSTSFLKSANSCARLTKR